MTKHGRMVQRQHRRAALNVRRAEPAALATLVVIDDQARDSEGALVSNAVDNRRRRRSRQSHADRPIGVDDVDTASDDPIMIRRHDPGFRRPRLNDLLERRQ